MEQYGIELDNELGQTIANRDFDPMTAFWALIQMGSPNRFSTTRGSMNKGTKEIIRGKVGPKRLLMKMAR